MRYPDHKAGSHMTIPRQQNNRPHHPILAYQKAVPDCASSMPSNHRSSYLASLHPPEQAFLVCVC